MSIAAMKLCSLILQEHFGETVKSVCECLFASKTKTVNGICQTSKLSRKQVTTSLAILAQYNIVKFSPLEANENIAEYALNPDNIILFLRYPRYVFFARKKYGNPSALIVEQLLKSGVEVAEAIIFRSYEISETKDDNVMKELRDAFDDLVRNNYIIRVSQMSDDPVPHQVRSQHDLFEPPQIELKILKKAIDSKIEPTSNIYWTVNFDKFHQSFRDKILIDAMERQFDSNAGECFQFILQLMYNRTQDWAQKSNPISFSEMKQVIERKSKSAELVKYVDQYVTLIERNECGFLTKVDESGGGLYIVNMNTAFTQIAWGIIENVITQKFGSKATRIFRVVRLKKFIEQEDIQKEAMIPSKEAKFLTYRLLEENYLQLQTIKKAGSGGVAHKAFYLFKVNQYHIVLTLIETCYKALFNSMTRAIQDKDANKRLMEKAMRLQFIVDGMKERGESEEMIQEINETLTPPEKEIVEKTKFRLKRLESSEVVIDEMLMMLQLYVRLQSPQR